MLISKIWIQWPLLPALAGLLSLVSIRDKFFKSNLHDTNTAYPRVECPLESASQRMMDGSCNNLAEPAMGMVGMRFGRNVPLTASFQDEKNLLNPNPRKVSLEVMTRKEFIPATSVNFLTAAWVQFLSHDLFFHGSNNYLKPIAVPLEANDPFQQDFMYIPSTTIDPSWDPASGKAKTYRNQVTHWWDGSALYGSSVEAASRIRSFEAGKLKINQDGTLPYDMFGKAVTGMNENWWLGLELIHTLFTREHNAIAERLAEAYPSWTDEQLFHKARMINAAVMAKVHVFGWSTAMIDTPAMHAAMNVNWYGLLGKELKEANIKTPSAVLSGIIGNKTDLAGVPYSITEEFVSVYRMHSLIRDSLPIKNSQSQSTVETVDIAATRNSDSQELVQRHGIGNLFFSFGTAYPGAVVLNNHPRIFQDLELPLVQKFDLAAVDVLRDRERGVPRYNEFRRLVHLNPIKKFEDFRLDQETTAKLKALYQNDIELIDLQIGALAEPRQKGFAFGETFFQIFVGMASRRLMADRFYTEDFRPEIYTAEGIEWVKQSSLKNVILRHMPELAPALEGIDNAFKPWNGPRQ